MSMYCVADSYKIEGETVSQGDLGSGRRGWVCTCWDKRPPDQGSHANCYHTRVVEDALRLKIPIEESGPKVVSLKRR